MYLNSDTSANLFVKFYKLCFPLIKNSDSANQKFATEPSMRKYYTHLTNFNIWQGDLHIDTFEASKT